MRDYIDITGYGDQTRHLLPIGEPITDPVVIARLDAEREAQLQRWHEESEIEAREKGYESVDQMLDAEYWP